MIIVGLTGGIGSGKTTVLKMFKTLKIDCYIADIAAKELMNSSEEIMEELIREFGNEAYTEIGLNRKYIAKIVFENPKKLKILNSIVHPSVQEHFMNFVKSATSSYVIYENAILFENNAAKKCDFIITVTAPVNTRIERVLARDKTINRLDVLNRMKNQFLDEEKILKSDFVINNIELKETQKEVEVIHSIILKKIKEMH